MSAVEQISRIAPGLGRLLNYQRGDLRYDVAAGLSVAAVALPVGVAYAQLAGFDPVIGLYSSILPLVAYTLFGTSRQLIVGPDAATCALVAAAVVPLAGGNETLYLSLSLTLTFLVGLMCIGGSLLRLGALADFLSKPILVGYMNGVAISITLGQLGKVLGFRVESDGIVPRLMEIATKFDTAHLPTVGIAVLTFLMLVITRRFLPRFPAPLVAILASAGTVAFFQLEGLGVSTIGVVPAGLPPLHLPSFPLDMLPQLMASAAGVALISYSSMTITARSFAAKNGYHLDSDQEMAALGVANIAAALSHGFAISGTDSRTATSDVSGGRTQVTGLVAAAAIAAIMLFFTRPLQYVPNAALGVVLITSAMSLIDLATLRRLYRIDWRSFVLAMLTMLGIVAVGAIQAILVAVVLELLRLIRVLARPTVEELGEVDGHAGFHPLSRHPDAVTIPELVILRFNGPLVFFNADHFKSSVRQTVDAAGPNLKWLVFDMLPITIVDSTGIYAAEEVFNHLRQRGITTIAAGRKTEWDEWANKRAGFFESELVFHPTLRQAVKACRRQASNPTEN
jgi:high affinity sulfate transporter 1